MKAMILAAGYGKRLRPLTDKTPKPMISVAGKPLLQHHIERLVAMGITEIVINISWLAEQIENFFGDGSNFGVHITWSKEPVPLETGGGILKALPLLGDAPFILINGDIWTDFPLPTVTDISLEDDQSAWLLLVNNPQHNPAGDFGLQKGLISYQPSLKYTFSGISLFKPALFSNYAKNITDASCFPLRDVLRPAIESKHIIGSVYPGHWCDVGTMERYNQLNKHLGLVK
jgi:MurNAc alpha-1-phosphate uridylyltransferase